MEPADLNRNQGVPEPDFTFQADEPVQVFEDHDTRGDDRYPPVKWPPVFARLIAPDSSAQK
jgi:hypothetical protein